MRFWSEPLQIGARGFACLGLVLLLAGCAGVSGRQATDEERTEYLASVGLAESDRRAATDRLERFLQTYPDSPLGDDAALQLAEWAQLDGDEPRVMEWLGYVVREYPNQPSADEARVRLAAFEVKYDDEVAARRLLGRVRFEQLEPELRREAFRMLYTLTSEHVDRLGWLVREREVVAEQIALEADATEPGDPDPLPVLEAPAPTAAEGALAILDQEIAALLEMMTDEEVLESIDRLDDRLPAGRAWLVLTMRAIDRRDFDTAEDYFDEAEGLEFSRGDRGLYDQVVLSLQMREQLEREGPMIPTFEEVASRRPLAVEGADGTIGVVLPLTGRFAKYGEESLRGILLAADLFRTTPPTREELNAAPVRRLDEPVARFDDLAPQGPDLRSLLGDDEPIEIQEGLRIVIRDSQGTPEGAARAARELGARRDLMAILGPLMGESAEAAAEVAEELEIPMVALTSRESVPKDRSYVFRTRTTPGDEIRGLVSYAWENLEARRFAVLYPKDRYGRKMRDAFWTAVEDRGGKMVASTGYELDATDFAEPIRRMIGYALLTDAEKETLEERGELLGRARLLDAEDAAVARRVGYAIQGPEGEPLPPVVDFDALFIPDSHERIVLIAPQLTFHEVLDVRLLGPGDWNHPDLVEIGRNHVDRAVISALFHQESRFAFVHEFVERYEAIYGSEPDVFSAHSYDATRLVLSRLVAGDVTRENIRNGILRTEGFPGASGVMNVMPDGNAIKRPFMLQVRGSKIVSLD